ncbi:S49 family peptidase [Accumulibacter sp.]|uniref:S49 family peptidase n=1 Tax=Accumulibacter sp. TaxID=2053492 RepID=UPI0025E07645|nr:S49 family peptidase [Accumulibacter sp.]MCM8595183.1 S49 family peptidase [Accumulibacter sp.]MCM8625976.1 S49 family peptidase [Accumulibacter sp.]MDS4049329.1 S49 family peptidase [Accumulibacter sp.]
MRHHLLMAEFLATPWALMPERLNAVAAVLARWAQGVPASEEVLAGIEADRVAREARREATRTVSSGGIAVLPLYGLITQRGNLVDEVSGSGSVSTQQFAGTLREALADDSVSQILIDIDSPGGSVYGVAELADEIAAARGQKPIVAVANSLAASAAYWIGSSASELYVTLGGEVGSIGVWLAHFDYSQAFAAQGITPTLISAGKFKVEGNPYAPLDEEAQGFLQSRVNDYYASFTKAVARGRGVPIAQVREGMGQGRVLGAEAAQAQGMVDGVATFDEVVRKMRWEARSSARPKVSRLAQARNALATL